MHLSGKVGVVTGGSRGIGFAIAQALLQGGAKVVITGTNQETLNTAVHELQEAKRHGAKVAGLRADVRRYEDVERLMAFATEEFGGLDILINNAGVGTFR